MSKRREIEPLRTRPDYEEEKKRREGYIAVDDLRRRRVFFVDEEYRNLSVTSESVKHGGRPTRFKGDMGRNINKGDYIITYYAKRKFEVLRVEIELFRSVNSSPKMFIILKEVFKEK